MKLGDDEPKVADRAANEEKKPEKKGGEGENPDRAIKNYLETLVNFIEMERTMLSGMLRNTCRFVEKEVYKNLKELDKAEKAKFDAVAKVWKAGDCVDTAEINNKSRPNTLARLKAFGRDGKKGKGQEPLDEQWIYKYIDIETQRDYAKT